MPHGGFFQSFVITKFTFIFLLSLTVTAMTIYIVWQKRKMPFAKTLFILLSVLALWTFCSLLDSIITYIPYKVFIIRIQFSAAALSPALMLIFVLEYSQFYRAASLPAAALWLMPAAIIIFLTLTNDVCHNYLWNGYILSTDGSNQLILVKNSFYYYFFAPYVFIFMLINYFFLLFNSLKYVNYFRRQAVTIFFAFLIPLIGGICFIFELSPVPGLDLTPITFIATNPILAYAILKMGFLSSAPIVSELVLQTIDDALVVIDENKKVIDYNLCAKKFFSGYKTITTSMNIAVLFENQENTLKFINENNENNGKEMEFIFREQPLTWLKIIISPIKNAAGKTLAQLIILRDITINKIAELKISESRRIAEAANTAKSKFIATISHEIRTPINALTGFLELMRRKETDSNSREYLEEAVSASRLLLRIVNDILDMSKIGAGKLSLIESEFNLKKIIESSMALFEPLALEKNIKFEIFIDNKTPETLIGDSVRVSQIINNLLSNAFKFTSEGYISIKCNIIEETENDVSIEFKIKDSGPGIAPEDIKLLFEPFYQIKNNKPFEHEGSGLGLSICREITKMMNGGIYAESEKGKGSIFIFHIRLKKCHAAAIKCGNPEPKTSNPDYNGVNNKKTDYASLNDSCIIIETIKPSILIAEDNRLSGKVVKLFLENSGLSCDISDNGAAALKAIDKKNYDIILLDCQMPIMNGYDCCRAIRNREKKGGGFTSLIIAITASAAEDEKEKCMAAGMNDYIPKPLNFDLLLNKIIDFCFKKFNAVYGLNPVIFQKGFKKFYKTNHAMIGADSITNIYSQYIVSLNDSISNLCVALDNDNFTTLEIDSHKLKGLSGTLCVSELYSLLEKLEKQAAGKKINECKKTLGEIKILLYP